MGWFSNIFKKVKSFGRNAINGISKAGHWVRDHVRSGYNTVRKIPILGKAVETAVSRNIPIFGKSLKDIGGLASRGLDVVDDVKDGNFSKAYRDGRALVNDATR